MAGNARSMRDKEMAAYLKAHNVRRVTGLCPICHYVVGIERVMVEHIRQCKGRRRQGGRR